MTILDEIIASKKEEVEKHKRVQPEPYFRERSLFQRKPVSLKEVLMTPGIPGIIAEFKRKSPSKGIIHEHAKAGEITKGYVKAGASALSVLTDSHYFGGAAEDLKFARQVNDCPILRKDFIIDTYQISEAKAIGADVILLIGAALPREKLSKFTSYAHSLGLEVLYEIHNEKDLQKAPDAVDIIGVNNRDLKTFTVDINTSINLAGKIGDTRVKISESGLKRPDDLVRLKKAGFRGFLMGESFMVTVNPGDTCRQFIELFKKKVYE